MEVWLTPQQIAQMRLAGMPTTDRRVRTWAEKNFATIRNRLRGKGIEILLDSLPLEAQRDYYARFAARMTEEHTHESQTHEARLAGDVRAGAGGVHRAHGQRPAWIAGAVGAVLVADCGAAGGAGAAAEVFEPSRGGGRGDAVGISSPSARGARGAGAVTAPATPNVAVATPDVAPSVVLPAPGGEPIRVGLPSPALSSTALAATGAGGLTGGGWYAPASHKDERLIEAARRKLIIAPILAGEIKGRAQIEAHAKAHQTTAATLYRWVKAFKLGGDAALVDKNRADKGQARVILAAAWEAAMRSHRVSQARMLEIAAEITQAVRGLWAQQGKPSWRQVAMLAQTRLIALTVAEIGCAESAARRICKLTRRFVEGERRYSLVALKDRDAKGFYDRTPAVMRTRAALKPGDCVFGDVSPADIPVLRPDGEVAWARLIAWMDAATNMIHITGHLPGKGAGVRREHVALSFTAMCQSAPFGMPKRLYLDNGSEYSWAQMLDAWRELTRLTQGVFGGTWDAPMAGEHFGIVTRSLPFKPRAKLIEGAFGNLLRFMGWHPAFSGSDRMRKKVATLGKGVTPIPVEDLKGFLAQAVAAYNATPQEGHLAGKSPAERMAEFLADGFEPYHAPAEVLGFAFGETHEVRCRMGQVRVGGWTYYSRDLIAFDGEKVTVRWPRHAPDAAYVWAGGRVHVALAMPVFAWGDPEGAKFAAKLASEARQVVEVMRGQVAWLDPRELMGEFARLSGVAEVVEEASRRSAKVQLTAEAQQMVAARQAQLEAALARALPRNPDLVANRHGVVDEEADEVRLWLEDDERRTA